VQREKWAKRMPAVAPGSQLEMSRREAHFMTVVAPTCEFCLECLKDPSSIPFILQPRSYSFAILTATFGTPDPSSTSTQTVNSILDQIHSLEPAELEHNWCTP
jgi:hypothetical protein